MWHFLLLNSIEEKKKVLLEKIKKEIAVGNKHWGAWMTRAIPRKVYNYVYESKLHHSTKVCKNFQGDFNLYDCLFDWFIDSSFTNGIYKMIYCRNCKLRQFADWIRSRFSSSKRFQNSFVIVVANGDDDKRRQIIFGDWHLNSLSSSEGTITPENQNFRQIAPYSQSQRVIESSNNFIKFLLID